MNIKACLSSNTVHWATPTNLYNKFVENGYIDPCPLHSQTNGLIYDFINAKIYVNPPFKYLDTWVNWIIKQVNNNCIVWLLMPSRTDTKYFAKIFPYVKDIYFFKGRLKYNDGKGVSPFPSMILNITSAKTNKQTAHVITLDEFIERIKL